MIQISNQIEIKRIIAAHTNITKFQIKYSELSVDLSTITHILHTCKNIVWFNYHHDSTQFAEFDRMLTDEKSIVLTVSSNHLTVNHENLTNFFETCKYLNRIKLHDYPLKNIILECMIKNSPICETRIYKTMIKLWLIFGMYKGYIYIKYCLI